MIANPEMEPNRSQQIDLMVALKESQEEVTTIRQLVILISCAIKPGITSMELSKITNSSYPCLSSSFKQLTNKNLAYSITETGRLNPNKENAKRFRKHYLTPKGDAFVLKITTQNKKS